MEKQYFKQYSPALGRDMEWNVYGHAGRPMLYIPCQDGRYVDFENFHMTDTLGPWIENGEIMVFSIDTMDLETYSASWNPYDRIRRHEDWVRYITDEMVPFMRDMVNERNGWEGDTKAIVYGCSLGATHAANLYLRRPDLFDGCMALSGIYSTQYGFGDYMDELVYANSPVNYLPNMPMDHWYMDLYKQGRAVICCGQGAWEQPETSFRLRQIFEEKQIPIWVDVWGYDVNHDWPWWHKQAAYFMPYILGYND